VPGAFTPTYHLKHLPGFLDNADAFKKKGVHTVACVAVNDPFVMDSWAKATGGKGKVLFLSDGNGEFTKAIGLDFDGSGIGLGTRSKRYAMMVDDGVVTVLNLEESPGVADVSTAENLVAKVYHFLSWPGLSRPSTSFSPQRRNRGCPARGRA
jgi:peroxiredoxin